MKRLLPILLILCTAVFAQKSKLIISVSGELEIDMADVLMDGISYGLKNNGKYQILINDRQFKETLKKEWKNGNISDDRIISLAKNAGADYLCFTKIKSVKGLKGKQVTASVYDLATMSYTDQMGMKTIKSDFSDLEDLTNIILNVVDDMLGTSNRAKKEEPKIVKEEPVQKSSNVYGNVLTDSRDGKKYKIVKIGSQTWMAENLNYNASGSKCYDNKESYCQKYGRLYNWNTARTACPSGWHLPSNADWNTLMKFINPSCSDNSDCAGAGTKLKSAKSWNAGYGYGGGTDNYGFSVLPGGAGGVIYGGDFGNVEYFTLLWSANENDSHNAYARYMSDSREYFGYYYYDKSNLFSVRCVQD